MRFSRAFLTSQVVANHHHYQPLPTGPCGLAVLPGSYMASAAASKPAMVVTCLAVASKSGMVLFHALGERSKTSSSALPEWDVASLARTAALAFQLGGSSAGSVQIEVGLLAREGKGGNSGRKARSRPTQSNPIGLYACPCHTKCRSDRVAGRWWRRRARDRFWWSPALRRLGASRQSAAMNATIPILHRSTSG